MTEPTLQLLATVCFSGGLVFMLLLAWIEIRKAELRGRIDEIKRGNRLSSFERSNEAAKVNLRRMLK